MAAYWLTFEGRGPACVEAVDAPAARLRAAELTGGRHLVMGLDRLPYPAEPRLNRVWSDSTVPPCPSFCYSPATCAGRGSCPKRPSCVD